MAVVDNPQSIEGIKVVQEYDLIAEELIKGNEVYHWESGDSMDPILRNMEYCKIIPIQNTDGIKLGDPVFCKLKAYDESEYFMVHMVTLISDKGADGRRWFQIGSTLGDIYGWTQDIYGIARGTGIFQKGKAKDDWWKTLFGSGKEE